MVLLSFLNRFRIGGTKKLAKEKKRKRALAEEKFTRARKVMKKNTKPKAPLESLESSVNRIKDGESLRAWMSV